MAEILAYCEVAPILSDEHFSVDGTLVKAWASMKSFQLKTNAASPDDDRPGDPPARDTTPETEPAETAVQTNQMPRNFHHHRNAKVDFKEEKRSNATSITDSDSRLYKKSIGGIRSYLNAQPSSSFPF
jgi:hypothetical protein